MLDPGHADSQRFPARQRAASEQFAQAEAAAANFATDVLEINAAARNAGIQNSFINDRSPRNFPPNTNDRLETRNPKRTVFRSAAPSTRLRKVLFPRP